ncbi:MAG: hypothetical protein M3198_04740 [Actinomycetota bacterium]|nr:hypothetical protein [Actinomycetota bacterium]
MTRILRKPRANIAARGLAAFLVVCILAVGCDSTSPPEKEAAPSPAAPEKFERLPQATPPVMKAKLTPEQIQRCLYPAPIDLDSIAGVYSSPEELVAAQVETSRSIDFDIPALELLEGKAFDKAVVGAGVSVPPDKRVTTKLLAWALGITPQGLNVNFFLRSDDAGLVAGFYDPRGQRVVIKKKGKLDSEYVVMAHEFTHAAADQRFGLPPERVEPIVDDVSLARSALVEGDASLTDLRVLSRLSPAKAVGKAVAARIAFKDKFAKDRGSGIPYLLIDTALFPYQSGLAFACSVFRETGWAGIDRAYSKPPTTTAQILFPDRFLDKEEALEPSELKRPGQLWQVRDEGQIGAAHLKAMFEAPGDSERQTLSRPLSRAASWAGGRYRVWTVGEASGEYAIGLSFVEHEDYEGLLCSSLRKWYLAAFDDAKQKLIADRVAEFEGTQQDAILSCQGRDITMAFGPRLEFARAILGLD